MTFYTNFKAVLNNLKHFGYVLSSKAVYRRPRIAWHMPSSRILAGHLHQSSIISLYSSCYHIYWDNRFDTLTSSRSTYSWDNVIFFCQNGIFSTNFHYHGWWWCHSRPHSLRWSVFTPQPQPLIYAYRVCFISDSEIVSQDGCKKSEKQEEESVIIG